MKKIFKNFWRKNHKISSHEATFLYFAKNSRVNWFEALARNSIFFSSQILNLASKMSSDFFFDVNKGQQFKINENNVSCNLYSRKYRTISMQALSKELKVLQITILIWGEGNPALWLKNALFQCSYYPKFNSCYRWKSFLLTLISDRCLKAAVRRGDRHIHRDNNWIKMKRQIVKNKTAHWSRELEHIFLHILFESTFYETWINLTNLANKYLEDTGDE